jgi:MFS family permease
MNAVVQPKRNAFFLLIVIYLGFISLGLPDGALGVAWPQMHVALNVPVGVAGTIMIVMTLLAAVSGFASGRVIARFHTGPVVLVSCSLTGAALVLISQAQGLAWLYVAAVPLGLGAGAVDAGLNGYVARHYTGRHMNWLHACWGIGATCGPIVMAHALGLATGWRGGYFALGAAQLTLALVFLLTLRLWDLVPERHVRVDTDDAVQVAPTTGANSWAGWLSPVIFSVYVAVEATTGLWTSSILVLGRGFSQETAGLCTASYYAAITTGRILVGVVVERWGNRRLVTGGGLVALVGALLFAVAHTTPLATAALVLIGLGLAPIYPGLMHEVPRRFAPEAVQIVIGRQSGAAYIGGAVFPAVAGLLAQVSLEAITWTIIAIVGVLLGSIHYLNRLTPAPSQERPLSPARLSAASVKNK